jgi:hypothetical protein
MFIKSLIAVVAVASTLAVVAPAEAGVKVYLGGGFDNGYGYDGYSNDGYGYDGYQTYEPDRFYEPRPYHQNRGISCEDGARKVRYAGFRKVRVLDCDSRRYTYKARRHGEVFVVTVSRRRGQIVSVEQVY